MKIGLVLEGGAMRGLYTAGVLDIFLDNEIKIDGIFPYIGLEPNIEYIDMPEQLKNKYQYYTQAEMKKLREVGYKKEFLDVQAGVQDYVLNHLHEEFAIY